MSGPRKFKISIFTLLIILILGIIISLYLVGSLMYLLGADTVKKQVKISAENQMKAYINNFESEFERIQELSNEFTTDKSLHRLAVFGNDMSDIQRTESILNVTTRMVSINQSSQYINVVEIYIPSIDRVLSTGLNMISENTGNIKNKFLRAEALELTKNHQSIQFMYPYIKSLCLPLLFYCAPNPQGQHSRT